MSDAGGNLSAKRKYCKTARKSDGFIGTLFRRPCSRVRWICFFLSGSGDNSALHNVNFEIGFYESLVHGLATCKRLVLKTVYDIDGIFFRFVYFFIRQYTINCVLTKSRQGLQSNRFDSNVILMVLTLEATFSVAEHAIVG